MSAIEAQPHRFVGGRNSWVAQSFLRLRSGLEACGHAVRLSSRTEPGTLCVVHRDDANDFRESAHRSFLVVIRADRAPVAACDFAIAQNSVSLGQHERYVPLWPQPGLRARDPSRGTFIRRMVYQGRTRTAPAWFYDSGFHAALARRSIRFDVRTRHWEDYRDADVTIAARDDVRSLLVTKPGTKIYNSWHAGVPVLATPEPAYHELIRSPYDFLEVNSARDVIYALDYLRASPSMYTAMVENGRKRARQFSVDAIRNRWLELFEQEFIPAFEASRAHLEARRIWFLAAMARQKLASRLWRTRAQMQRRHLNRNNVESFEFAGPVTQF